MLLSDFCVLVLICWFIIGLIITIIVTYKNGDEINLFGEIYIIGLFFLLVLCNIVVLFVNDLPKTSQNFETIKTYELVKTNDEYYTIQNNKLIVTYINENNENISLEFEKDGDYSYKNIIINTELRKTDKEISYVEIHRYNWWFLYEDAQIVYINLNN